MILVVGMRNEFGPDAKYISPLIEAVLEHERQKQPILHINSDIIPTYKDQIIHSEKQLQLLTFGKEFIYLMGIHFGRCLLGWEKVMSCPIRTVINCTMLHEDDTWHEKINRKNGINKRNFYLWSYKGFYRI